MVNINRREFLKYSHLALGSIALSPLFDLSNVANAQDYGKTVPVGGTCWLDVCAPFVVDDEKAGVRSELVLTSSNFVGRRGFEDKADSTEYEILLYGQDGKAIGQDGIAKHLTVPAMQTTVIPVRDLVGSNAAFSGGMTVRMRPRTRTPMHVSDLFSSAFIRWRTEGSFDNVHANPDPLQWKVPNSFYYSMPFPSLNEYRCTLGLFNPYDKTSRGTITFFSPEGKVLRETSYDLRPFTSMFIDVATGLHHSDGLTPFQQSQNDESNASKRRIENTGTIAVTNRTGAVKSFAYLLMQNLKGTRFSVDHPIHQSPFVPVRSENPFDEAGRLKAKNVLFTPLVFRSKKIGGITLESRFHLSAGAPIEENLWLSPFITDSDGEVAWAANETSLPSDGIAKKQLHRGVIKLAGHESCTLDCAAINLPNGMSGGLSLGVRATTNHTLMKAEVRVPEWNAHAFTHFRPGLASAREYQKSEPRGGLMTDYITSGAHLIRANGTVVMDEVIGVMNIDDRAIAGQPTLEIFAKGGLVERVALAKVPPFACRHFLLSEQVGLNLPKTDLTLRLVDENATLLMSVLHIDYARRDIALDHGSDRFSTYIAYACESRQA